MARSTAEAVTIGLARVLLAKDNLSAHFGTRILFCSSMIDGARDRTPYYLVQYE